METRNDKRRLVAFRSTHPGELLKAWLGDLGISQKDFAAAMGVPASRLNELIRGKRPMTEGLAKRIAGALGARMPITGCVLRQITSGTSVC